MIALSPLRSPAAGPYWLLVAVGAAVVLAGFGAAHFMEIRGHIVTGMNNQVVWGLPHVFAIFLIVAASGVLNVASIGSVFGQTSYKPRGPLSGLLSIALLAGGLFVLMLDLGRPERMLVPATHINPTSMFSWNALLYPGMFGLVAVYLWVTMERRMGVWAGKAGIAVFIWRLVLTTGTGLIFAFLVARPAYGSGLLPPLFIVLSFAWGMALYLLVQLAINAATGTELPADLHRRLSNLLGVFSAGGLYLALVIHLTHAYFARQLALERFLLADGGVYPLLFWGGYVLIGATLPMALLWGRRRPTVRSTVGASALVVAGGFAFLYVFIIGGQVWPLEIFPGYDVSSSFGDGAIASYAPSLPELLLGVGGVGVAVVIAAIGMRLLPFVPEDAARVVDAPAVTPASGSAPGGAKAAAQITGEAAAATGSPAATSTATS